MLLMGLAGAVAAGPQPACPAAPDLQQQALALVNTLRAQARSCGAAVLPAAAALRWDPRLLASAQAYAEELARRDTLSHEGQQARSLRERLRTAGYRMRLAGENLAAGPDTVEEALAQWLASPAHCDNLMAAEFDDMGLACVPGQGRYEHYWVLHLGRGVPN